MENFAYKNIKLEYLGDDILILNSFEDFQEWYLHKFDFSMFLLEDIDVLLDEEKPEIYPCTPLVLKPYGNMSYLALDDILIIKK